MEAWNVVQIGRAKALRRKGKKGAKKRSMRKASR